jgi:hypothetical protein
MPISLPGTYLPSLRCDSRTFSMMFLPMGLSPLPTINRVYYGDPT